MTIIRKDATISNTGDDKDFPGTFEVILSAPTKDRDGDTLLPEDWKQPLPEHITFDMDHGMSVASTIGSGVPELLDDGRLKVAGTYTSLDRGQDTRTLVKEGHIKTTSVAFMTEKSQEKDGSTSVKRELLNGAFVAIPSNRESVVLSSKALVEKAGARNSATDAEHIQAIHDHAIALGADPAGATAAAEKSARRAQTKSVAGSLEATQDRARDALQDAYPGVWAWLQATIPNGDGGTLVFQLENPVTYDNDTWQQQYTDDGSVITLTGERSAVDLVQIIKPDPDEEDSATDGDAATAAEKSAAAASKAAAEDAESNAPTDDEFRVRAFKQRLDSIYVA
jgi:hypothetical protein